MREAILEGTGLVHQRSPFIEGAEQHPGLLAERLAFFLRAPANVKVDTPRADFADKLAKLPVSSRYLRRFPLLRSALRASCWTVEVEANSPLLVGHALRGAFETGLSLHRTWGVPYIPGSALKGVFHHYADEVLAAQDPAWLGPHEVNGAWQSAGAWHSVVFGEPETQPGIAAAGAVVFEDALLVPVEGAMPLQRDVVTPHLADYYSNHTAFPTEWESPQPHAFVSVRPRQRFLLALGGHRDWAGLVLPLLLRCLQERGVGGKTRAGYGRLSCARDADGVEVPVRPPGDEAAQAAMEQAHADAARAALQAAYEGFEGGALRTLVEDKVWNAACVNDRVKTLLRLLGQASDSGLEIADLTVGRVISKGRHEN